MNKIKNFRQGGNITMKYFTPILMAVAVALGGVSAASAQEKLPANLANDPVAKALGAKIINAAIKEGVVNWYGTSTTRRFLKKTKSGKKFEKRFGIKVQAVTGRTRAMADRIRTESAVGKLVADVFDGNEQYMFELQELDILVKWRPPAPEIANLMQWAFVKTPKGYWWPMHVSAQALIVNTDMIKPSEYPKSYWDIVDPKWKGKVAIRDPRAASGGAWMMLGIYSQPGLGLDYIKKLYKTVNPFIIRGGSRKMRDAIATGQFAIGFSGRGEFIRDLPKGTPIAYVVPKEGMTWTGSGIALLNGAKNPNAGKLLMTWIFELKNLQGWNDQSRPVPHPKIKPLIPEMSITAYPLMNKVPDKSLAKPNFFFKEMEKVFGIR